MAIDAGYTITAISGKDGTNGQNGASLSVQYSVDGSSNWHNTFASGDIYMRQKLGSGSWSSAMKIIGEDGQDGEPAKFVEIEASSGLVFKNGIPSQLPLKCVATGFSPSSYKWYKDGTVISGATSQTYNATSAGVYKVVCGDYSDIVTIIAVSDGQDGDDGRGISSTEIKYASSTSNTTAPSSGWQDTPPSVSAGSYLWTKTTIKYTSGSDSVSYSVARQGNNGTNGTSVTITSKSIQYQASSSGTTTPTGTWSDTVPSVSTGQYLWTKTVVNYSDGNSTTSYSVGYKGTNGTDGTSPYSCSVGNENFTVATGTDLKPLSVTTYSVKFQAYKGSTQLSPIAPSATIASGKFKVSTPTASGFTVAQDTAGTLTFKTATGTAISANLTVSVTVTYDNDSTETKVITISASKTGAKGDNSVTYEIDCPMVFKKADTVTFNFFKVESGVRTAASVYARWYYSTDGSTWTEGTGSKVTATSLTTTALNSSIKVKCEIYANSSASTALDVEYSNLLTDGTNGARGSVWYTGNKITGTSTTATIFSGSGITDAKVGDMYKNTDTSYTYQCTVAGNASTAKWVYTGNMKGGTGSAATNVYLGNENITLACDKDGKLKSALSTTVKVGAYTGTARVASTITKNSNSSNVTVGTITNGTTSADGSVPLTMSASTAVTAGELVLKVVANSITFYKTVTISVAKDGQKGDPAGAQIARGTITTTVLVSSTDSTWDKKGWRRASSTNANVTSVDVTDCPNPMITKGWKLAPTAGSSSTSTSTAVSQDSCPIYNGKKYTLSCWARKASANDNLKLRLQIWKNSSHSGSSEVDLTTEWKKYSFTWTADIDTMNIYFGVKAFQNSSYIEICGMKCELGDTATEWCEYEGDIIQNTEVTYQKSSSGTVTPTGTWSTTIPSLSAGEYLWTRTVTTYSGGSSSTSYAVSRNGTNGATGVSMRSKGAWAASTAYVNDTSYIDVVSYNGSSYACKTSHTSGSTFDSSKWNLLANKGDDGVDSYSCETSASAVSVSTGTDRKPTSAGSVNIVFKAFKGTTQLSPVASSSSTVSASQFRVTTPSNAGNITVTQSTNGTLNFAWATANAIDATRSFVVTVAIGSTTNTVTKTITISASIKGGTGGQGSRAIRYIGKSATKPNSSNQTSGTPVSGVTPIVGDWYLCTTDGAVYYCSGISGTTYTWTVITWLDTSTVPDYRLLECLEDMLVLSETITDNTTMNNIIDKYIDVLIANEAFINYLSTKTINFKNSVSSITKENVQVNDRMIYMGKNPLEEGDQEFRFGISRCRRIVGNHQDWTKDYFTDYLSTGIFGLHTSGIIQATDGIYANVGSEVQKESPIEALFTNMSASDGTYNFYVVPYGAEQGTKYAFKYSKDFIEWTTQIVDFDFDTYGTPTQVAYLNGNYIFTTSKNQSGSYLFYKTSIDGSFTKINTNMVGFYCAKIIYSKYTNNYYSVFSAGTNSFVNCDKTLSAVVTVDENYKMIAGYVNDICMCVNNGTSYVIAVTGDESTHDNDGWVYRLGDADSFSSASYARLNANLRILAQTLYGAYPRLREVASNDNGLVFAVGGIQGTNEQEPAMFKIDVSTVDSQYNRLFYKEECKFINQGRIYSIASIGNSFIMGNSYGEIVHIDANGELKTYGVVDPRKGKGEYWGVSHINPLPHINAVVLSCIRYASATSTTKTGYAHFLSFGSELLNKPPRIPTSAPANPQDGDIWID